jgi:hypothetical protein
MFFALVLTVTLATIVVLRAGSFFGWGAYYALVGAPSLFVKMVYSNADFGKTYLLASFVLIVIGLVVYQLNRGWRTT